MIAALLAALALAAPPAAAEPPAPAKPAAEQKPPASTANAVDENGVPAWAKRKHMRPVQACETKPNIGVETWRERYDATGKDRLKPRPPTATCR